MADIILWMLVAGKRVAFHRLSARSILHATQRAFVGNNCSRLQEIFLKVYNHLILNLKFININSVIQIKIY